MHYRNGDFKLLFTTAIVSRGYRLENSANLDGPSQHNNGSLMLN